MNMIDHAASIPSLSERLTVPLSKEIAEPLLFWGELGLVVFGLAVAVGIIGEHVSEKRHDKWLPAHLRPHGWNWPFIWLAVVVIGVGLEFVCDAAIWESSASLQATADRETAALTEKAKQLESDAETAKKQTAQLQQDNLVLQKQVADAQKAAADAQAEAARAKALAIIGGTGGLRNSLGGGPLGGGGLP
jgi:hypothetical protein